MTIRKKASGDFCQLVYRVMREHAKQARAEIEQLCEKAQLDGQLNIKTGSRENLMVRMMGQVRHRIPDDDGFHNSSEEGILFEIHLP